MSVAVEHRDCLSDAGGHQTWSALLEDSSRWGARVEVTLYEPEHGRRKVAVTFEGSAPFDVRAQIWLRSRDELVAARDALAAAVDAWPDGEA